MASRHASGVRNQSRIDRLPAGARRREGKRGGRRDSLAWRPTLSPMIVVVRFTIKSSMTSAQVLNDGRTGSSCTGGAERSEPRTHYQIRDISQRRLRSTRSAPGRVLRKSQPSSDDRQRTREGSTLPGQPFPNRSGSLHSFESARYSRWAHGGSRLRQSAEKVEGVHPQGSWVKAGRMVFIREEVSAPARTSTSLEGKRSGILAAPQSRRSRRAGPCRRRHTEASRLRRHIRRSRGAGRERPAVCGPCQA